MMLQKNKNNWSAYSLILIISIITFVTIGLLIRTSQNFPPQERTVLGASITEGNISVYPQGGEVYFREPTQDNYEQINSAEKLVVSDTFIKTSLAYAEVLLPDNSLISIDKNTELQISYQDGKTSIRQFFGSTWHNVQKLVENKTYEIETSTAIAKVKGTSFKISNDLQESVIKVLEGAVGISQKLPEHEIQSEGALNKEKILKANETIIITEDRQILEKISLSEEDGCSEWDLRVQFMFGEGHKEELEGISSRFIGLREEFKKLKLSKENCQKIKPIENPTFKGEEKQEETKSSESKDTTKANQAKEESLSKLPPMILRATEKELTKETSSQSSTSTKSNNSESKSNAFIKNSRNTSSKSQQKERKSAQPIQNTELENNSISQNSGIINPKSDFLTTAIPCYEIQNYEQLSHILQDSDSLDELAFWYGLTRSQVIKEIKAAFDFC